MTSEKSLELHDQVDVLGIDAHVHVFSDLTCSARGISVTSHIIITFIQSILINRSTIISIYLMQFSEIEYNTFCDIEE